MFESSIKALMTLVVRDRARSNSAIGYFEFTLFTLNTASASIGADVDVD